MSRLAQLGVFNVVLGGVVLFIGLFPAAVDADATPGMGTAQILLMLSGLILILMGAYIVAHALLRRGQARSLRAEIGVRLGLTGMVFAAAATLADAMGFGSHGASEGLLFGWLQTIGVLLGFGVAAFGVLIYGTANS